MAPRLRILFVIPQISYPPVKGYHGGAYNLMRILSERHEIFLLYLSESQKAVDRGREFEKFCAGVHTIRFPKWRSFINVGLAVFSSLPAQVLYYRSRHFQSEVERIVKSNRIDIVHALLLRTVPAVGGSTVPVLIDLVDSMQTNLRSRIPTSGWLLALLIKMEISRVEKYESYVAARFNAITVVSATDKASIGGDRTHVIPLGVDLASFFPRPELRRSTPTVLFAGNMAYGPNVSAAVWFVKRCWPAIKTRFPTARFVIAGKDPSSRVEALSDYPGVEIIGYVSSMAECINQAWVSVAPMQSGSGMQNKILEAMACGVPVVTSTLGLGDIKATPGVEILVEDLPDRFVEKVSALLECPTRGSEIGGLALQFVRYHHSWDVNAAAFEKIYHHMLN